MKKERVRTLQSAKFIKKKKKQYTLKVILISLAIIVIIVAILFFLRISFIQLSSINVVGNQTVNIDEVRLKAQSILQGEYLGIIPKTNYLFYPKQAIRNELIQNFNNIDSVQLSRIGLSILNIEIKERTPEAIVCEGFKEEDSDEGSEDNCYFSDNKAYIYDKSIRFPESEYNHYYVSPDSSDISIGKTFIDTDKFINLQLFIKKINDSGIPVIGILVADAGNYELYVRNKDNSLAVVYFDDRTSFDKTYNNFTAFWQSAMNKKLGTTTIPIFDYINVKFGNNVFFTTK